MTELIRAFGLALCIAYKGSGEIDQVSLILVMQYTAEMNWINMMLHRQSWFQNQLLRAQRFLDLNEIPQERYEYSSSKEEDPIEVEKREDQLQSDWPSRGAISFNEVELRYRHKMDLVLRKLSFDVHSGEKIGIVGRTGAGKSTISMALSRLVELSGGSITIDGIDIAKIGLNQLRQNITFIPQDPCLFTGSLRYNIDPFGNISDDEILQLAERAGLQEILKRRQTPEMIQSKRTFGKKKKKGKKGKSAMDQLSTAARHSLEKGGVYFWITENGSNLSVGERQLVCFCRAILRKNRIVMLDEATANIDVVTECKIQELISSEFKYSTVLTIAHRLNTIINSDRILVLDAGQKVEFADPKTLIADESSRFYKLLQELKKGEKVSETTTMQ